MRGQVTLLYGIIFLLILSPYASAHEAKNYTFILREDASSTKSVSPGILVETDSIFFVNMDKREGANHRILIDADDDGNFSGIDDLSTKWLFGSCELDDNGSKENEDCMVNEFVLLAPENGLLPGNISMIHQVKFNDQISNFSFHINFGLDIHSMINNTQELSPQINENISVNENLIESNDNNYLILLSTSLLGILIMSSILVFSGKKESE